MSATRVLIADDHPVFRAGMVTVLQDLDGVDVVGQAADGEEALAGVAEHRAGRGADGPADARASAGSRRPPGSGSSIPRPR